MATFLAHPSTFFPFYGGATGLAGRLLRSLRRHRAEFSAVIDVGCNVGDWTSSWLAGDVGSSASHRVFCIEAHPEVAARTRARFARQSRVEVINAALSNRSGWQELYGLPSSSRHAAKQTGAGLGLTAAEARHVSLGRVRVHTLDELLRQRSMLARGGLFVKVDTEGFDLHVLSGAACALRAAAVDVVVIEWNRRKLPTTAPCATLRRVALWLESLGLEAFLVGQPYAPLNFGWWDDAYDAARLACPPFCTGDIVGLRRGWNLSQPLRRELAPGISFN